MLLRAGLGGYFAAGVGKSPKAKVAQNECPQGLCGAYSQLSARRIRKSAVSYELCAAIVMTVWYGAVAGLPREYAGGGGGGGATDPGHRIPQMQGISQRTRMLRSR